MGSLCKGPAVPDASFLKSTQTKFYRITRIIQYVGFILFPGFIHIDITMAKYKETEFITSVSADSIGKIQLSSVNPLNILIGKLI